MRTYRPCLLAQAARFGLTPWQRQDLEQRVWLTLLENASKIRDAACLPGWLATTARRTAMHIRYQGDRELVVDELPEAVGHDSDVEDQFLDAELAVELRTAIAHLPRRQQSVVEALMNDMSYEDLSSRYGIPIGSIGPTRQRALSTLRLALAG